jgi:hypothetical protein
MSSVDGAPWGLEGRKSANLVHATGMSGGGNGSEEQAPPRRKGVTKADLDAYEREHPEIIERRKAARQGRQESIRQYRDDQAPVVADLRAAGVAVDAIHDLSDPGVNGAEYSRALPVLIQWLPRMANPEVKLTIIQALATPRARMAAHTLIDEFRRPQPREILRWDIGNALSYAADASVFEEIAELALDPRYGTARQELCLALARTRDTRAADFLLQLLEDEDVTAHAVEALGKLKAARARPAIEGLLSHPKELVRREAKRALARIDKATNTSSRP